jgi:hypothetical protein
MADYKWGYPRRKRIAGFIVLLATFDLLGWVTAQTAEGALPTLPRSAPAVEAGPIRRPRNALAWSRVARKGEGR